MKHARAIVTVIAISAFGVAAMLAGQPILAAAAGGALFSYLGRLNGAPRQARSP